MRQAILLTAAFFVLTSATPTMVQDLTVQDLREMCITDDTDGRQKCEHRMVAYQDLRELVTRMERKAANKPTLPDRVCPLIPPSDALRELLSWSDRHPEEWQKDGLDAALLAWGSKHPCAQ